jgi:Transglutaminase-like superfamily
MIQKIHNRRLFLKTALAQAGVIATSTFDISAHGYRSRPTRPLAMAGFNERRDDPARWERHQEIVDEQNKFCREKAELIGRMDACRHDGKGPPAIVHFNDMIDYVRDVPDKRMQALLVNAWINLAISYDPPTRPYRSLIGALTDAKGCCYEIAELKLAALEILGFAADDVRLVGELSTTNGKRDEIGHTVVEIRIDGQNWIMNDQHMRAEFIPTRSAFFLASYHSVMEPDCVHVNYSNNSLWTPNVKYFPWGSYNSAYLARYEGVTRSDPPVKGGLPQFPPVIEKYISLGTVIGEDATRRQQIIDFFYPVLPPISRAAVDEAARWNAQSFARVSETDATQKYYPVGGADPVNSDDSSVSLVL